MFVDHCICLFVFRWISFVSMLYFFCFDVFRSAHLFSCCISFDGEEASEWNTLALAPSNNDIYIPKHTLNILYEVRDYNKFMEIIHHFRHSLIFDCSHTDLFCVLFSTPIFDSHFCFVLIFSFFRNLSGARLNVALSWPPANTSMFLFPFSKLSFIHTLQLRGELEWRQNRLNFFINR